MERSMKFWRLLIAKTVILEIEGWSILYELLISFNPTSSMLYIFLKPLSSMQRWESFKFFLLYNLARQVKEYYM